MCNDYADLLCEKETWIRACYLSIHRRWRLHAAVLLSWNAAETRSAESNDDVIMVITMKVCMQTTEIPWYMLWSSMYHIAVKWWKNAGGMRHNKSEKGIALHHDACHCCKLECDTNGLALRVDVDEPLQQSESVQLATHGVVGGMPLSCARLTRVGSHTPTSHSIVRLPARVGCFVRMPKKCRALHARFHNTRVLKHQPLKGPLIPSMIFNPKTTPWGNYPSPLVTRLKEIHPERCKQHWHNKCNRSYTKIWYI